MLDSIIRVVKHTQLSNLSANNHMDVGVRVNETR